MHQRRRRTWHVQAGNLRLSRQQRHVLRRGAAPRALFQIAADALSYLFERKYLPGDLPIQPEHVHAIARVDELAAGLPWQQGKQSGLEFGRGVAAGDLAEAAALAGRRAVRDGTCQVFEPIGVGCDLAECHLGPRDSLRIGGRIVTCRPEQDVLRLKQIGTEEFSAVGLVVTAARGLVRDRCPDLQFQQSPKQRFLIGLSQPFPVRGVATTPSVRARCNRSSRTTSARVACSQASPGVAPPWFCTSRAMSALAIIAWLTATVCGTVVRVMTVRMVQSSPTAG